MGDLSEAHKKRWEGHEAVLDKNLLDYTTPRQKEILEAYIEYKTHRKAAEALGITQQRVFGVIKQVEKKATLAGYSPKHDMTHPIPEPFIAKGHSTLYDEEGNVKLQWVKTKLDDDLKLKSMLSLIENASDELKGLCPTIKPPKTYKKDMEVAFIIPEPHMGLLSCAEETGDNYDLKMAEELLLGAVAELLESAPQTESCVIVNIGDFFHSDSSENKTARSGNVLDVDSRWWKILMTGFKVVILIIEKALEKYRKVEFVNSIGNHDDHSSIMLSVAINAYFHANPRLKIDMSPAVFHYRKFGKNLFGITHGHTLKGGKLAMIMANDKKEWWGQTEHHYWYVGHYHHRSLDEVPGCIIEGFGSIAGKDAYTAGKFRSRRDMQAIVYHNEFGEVFRHTASLTRILASAKKRKEEEQ